MRYKGDAQKEALRRLFENQSAIECGHTPPYAILGFATAGGFSAIRVAYELTEVYEAGIVSAFTHFRTISGGGGPVGGYLSKNPKAVAATFEYLARNKLMTGCLIRPRLDIELFQRALRGEEGPGGFIQKKIVAHPTRWDVIATRVEDATPVRLCAKTDGRDAAEVVAASSAMPGACAPVEINRVKFCDGACNGALQIRQALHDLPAIDTVVVFQSRPHPKHCSWFERHVWPKGARVVLWAHRVQRNIREGVAHMGDAFVQEANTLASLRGVVWGRIAPTRSDVPVGVTTTDTALLRDAGEEAGRFMRQCLREVRPVRWV